MRSVDDLEVLGRRVLLRSDLNVPLDLTGTGEITDDGRIRASLPVISKLSDRGARVIILAHLGRPKGDSFAERAAGGPSLRPVAERLGELLGRPVAFATDVAGESAAKTAFSLGDEDVAVLENVRFEPAETSKDDAERGAFAQQLARFGELYVDDAFGAVHRKHASVYDLPALLPHAAGDLVRDEVSVLRQLTTDPGAPVRGGARRQEAVGQARRDREPAGPGRPHPHRRRHGVHVPRRAGLRGGELGARSRPDPRGQGGHGGGRSGAAWNSCCPSTWSPRRTSPRTPSIPWCR